MKEEMQRKLSGIRVEKNLLQGDSTIETPMLILHSTGFAALKRGEVWGAEYCF